jgi:uncharacterized protein
VDVNTASVPLLSHISGLNAGLARNIVEYRDKNGAFSNRNALKEVPRLGEKSFEQAGGFLRIMNGDNPLDASAVHPETYPVVERIVEKTEKPIKSLIGDGEFLQNLQPEDYMDDTFGVPTVSDIISELEKPGRDPRPEFKTPTFKEGINDLEDLEAEMILEGIVTNVTNFGAFVDVGVHHDGLVHISAMSNTYVKDPRDVVKAGDVVKVKVLGVDLKRRRVALSLDFFEGEKGEAGGMTATFQKKKTSNKKRKTKKPIKASSRRSSSDKSNRRSFFMQPKLPDGFVGIMASAMTEAFANVDNTDNAKKD